MIIPPALGFSVSMVIKDKHTRKNIKNKILILAVILLSIIMIDTVGASTDKFGITKLYETVSGGREWTSQWDNSHARTWTDSSNDPYDPEFFTKDKGTGTYKTDGNGTLKISGDAPRMFVVDPAQTGRWRNVEITVYGQRVSDDNTEWGGIMAYARTNHFIDSNYCDTRGYGGRFRYDGDIDFEKETKHDSYYDSVATKTYWPVSMKKNIWIGYKYVVYDMPDGNVKLELWIDKTDGFNGGNWKKVNEFIDTGSNFGVEGMPCKSGIKPALRLTASDTRPGSETGKPNLAVYFRSDGVGTDGLWYKKASVREITPFAGVWIDLTNNSGEITVNDSPSLGDLSSATWNIWALQNQYTENAGLFGKFQASSGKRSYLIRTSGSEISIVLSGDGINTETLYSGCGLQNNNEWTMITATYNGTHITFYRNGQKCTSKPTAIRSLKNAPVPLRIGGGNNIFFNGSIDGTLMSNKQLPGSQIYRLFQESEHGLAGRRSIPVILYHQLKDTADESDILSINNFKKQIAYLHNNNFTTITPENFYQWQKDNFTMPERPVIIYFDDGWDDVYNIALPILNQYGYVGTTAVVAYYADEVSYGDWTGYMTWDQLRELQNNGWEIASHGFQHLHMTNLSEAEFRYQLNYSREEIKNELGRKPTSFVFPFHDADIPYTAICGKYYDLCWTYDISDAFPDYNLYADDGHAYQGLKRIMIYNITTMQTFQNMFAREVYPVGAWPLNEGTGSIAYDSSGNNNNVILNTNAKWHVERTGMLNPQRPESMLLPPTETSSWNLKILGIKY